MDAGIQTRRGRPTALAFVVAPILVALLVISAQVLRKPLKTPVLDEFYYLTIARDLNLHGVYTDGMFKGGPFTAKDTTAIIRDEDPGRALPGRFVAPAYPMLIHLLSRLDAALADSVRCHVGNFRPPPQGKALHTPTTTQCPHDFATLVSVQIVLAALCAVCIFFIAWVITRSAPAAWLSMLVALATGEFGYYAHTYLSENTTLPAFTLFALFSVLAIEYRKSWLFLAAGVALGAAALSRPAYLYLFYMLAAALAVAAVVARQRTGAVRPFHVAVFVAGGLCAIAPWLIRNAIAFGDLSMSQGYAAVILMQRVAYNQMSWGEWFVAWIYWLPDFGDALAKQLFAPHLYERLGWSHPQNYYLDGGSGEFRRRNLELAGDAANVLPFLLKTHVFGDFFKHVMVSLPLSMRGLGVAKYLSVAGVILFWPVARRLYKDGRLLPFLVLVLPPVLMAGLHGFVSVNIERYNLPMVAVYALIVSYGAIALYNHLRPPR